MFQTKSLSEDQKNTIRTWAAEGASMSDIQKNMQDTFGINVTYMDTRFLILDLGITLIEKKPEEKKVEPVVVEPSATLGAVTVLLDEINIPGMLFSGKVTFSDGQKAIWYVDETGRLGLNPDQIDYKPSQEDLVSFQQELRKLVR